MPESSSIGRPSAGGLQHGARLRSNQHWLVHDPDHAFVTRDVARWMEAGFAAVREHDEHAPRIEMRDASAEHGGPLHGHHSHQSGRDIDLAYFREGCRDTCPHHRADARTLDADRQWALLAAWLRAGVVEYVFIDHELQEPLLEAARRDGATPAELSRWFQWPHPSERRVGIIRHASGHRDHLHVRFVCAESDLRCGRVDSDRDDEP
jgi:penicillin-insensitive murein endopeptidase